MTRQSRDQQAISSLFDHAFSRVGQPEVRRSASPVFDQDFMSADIVSSHQLEFTLETADFLTRVVDQPHDFGLVYNFLSSHLSSPHQPLGRLALKFSTLYQKLYVPAPRAAESRPHLAPRSTSSKQAATLSASAASSMHLGVQRLHQILIEVMPPLQCAPASQAAMEAAQAVLYEQCAPTIDALIASLQTAKDAAARQRLGVRRETRAAGITAPHICCGGGGGVGVHQCGFAGFVLHAIRLALRFSSSLTWAGGWPLED